MSEVNNNYEKEVQEIIDIMEDKKAQDIKVYDMRGKSPFFDYSILCTGSSSRNIEAIATDIKKSLENVKSVEGLDEANWVLIDAGDLIISVFSKDAREYYRCTIYSFSCSCRSSFFTIGSTIVYITDIRCISVCGTGVTK